MNFKPALLTFALILALSFSVFSQGGGQYRVLVFSKTAGFRHQSIPEGVAAIKKLGQEQGFGVYTSEDAGQFTDENLAKYDVVVLLSTTGTILNEAQKAAFQKYVQSGKGVVGIHSATDTEYEWPWYNKMIGAYFLTHPRQQTLRLEVKDKNHPATWHLPENWLWYDELYEFRNINPDIKVLINADETTYEPSKGNGANHPMAWYHAFDGGRVFYTALGHVEAAWTNEAFLQHVHGGIWYAAKGKMPK